MFAVLERMFVGVELMSEAVEHKLSRRKNTFTFRFRQINQPNFDKKQLSFIRNSQEAQCRRCAKSFGKSLGSSEKIANFAT